MRFRILSDDELKHMETEFKHFLIINNMHSSEWEDLNKNEPEKALALVELFSDTVLLKVYEKVEFLEFRSKSLFSIYKITDENTHAIHLKSKNDSVSLETDTQISESLKNKFAELEIYRAQKKVDLYKADEVHKLVTQGCLVSNDLIWNQLNAIIVNT
jgi:hypothetical protein